MRQYLYSIITDKKKGFLSFILKVFLFILSLIYGLMVKILAFCYRIKPYKLNCKVISVGNITLGGTGKTPFVEMLARHLKEKGHKVAILSRGYKRKLINLSSPKANQPTAETYQLINSQMMGDEAYLLSKKLPEIPVFVGRDRIKNAKRATEKYNVDTIILDDGFQHWRLFRDLDVVLIDIKNPFGNNYLIPRGILREPVSSLKRAKIIILTKVDLKEENIPQILEKIKKINPKAEIFKAKYSPQDFIDISGNLYPLSFIKEKKICMLCGIADPDSFEFALNNLGAKLILKFKFCDHYEYKEKDVTTVTDSCIKNNIKIIVTTEKDGVRLEKFYKELEPYLYILRSKIKILEEDDFFKLVSKKLS